jgi:methoxymalonate biosynthesis acyl carrier protein
MTVDMANSNYEIHVIENRLSTLFSETMHVDVPSVDADLFDTGLLDSQRFVELLLHIEQDFDTKIDVEDFEIENFRCIEKIAALILQRKNGAATEATQLTESGTSSG